MKKRRQCNELFLFCCLNRTSREEPLVEFTCKAKFTHSVVEFVHSKAARAACTSPAWSSEVSSLPGGMPDYVEIAGIDDSSSGSRDREGPARLESINEGSTAMSDDIQMEGDTDDTEEEQEFINEEDEDLDEASEKAEHTYTSDVIRASPITRVNWYWRGKQCEQGSKWINQLMSASIIGVISLKPAFCQTYPIAGFLASIMKCNPCNLLLMASARSRRGSVANFHKAFSSSYCTCPWAAGHASRPVHVASGHQEYPRHAKQPSLEVQEAGRCGRAPTAGKLCVRRGNRKRGGSDQSGQGLHPVYIACLLCHNVLLSAHRTARKRQLVYLENRPNLLTFEHCYQWANIAERHYGAKDVNLLAAESRSKTCKPNDLEIKIGQPSLDQGLDIGNARVRHPGPKTTGVQLERYSCKKVQILPWTWNPGRAVRVLQQRLRAFFRGRLITRCDQGVLPPPSEAAQAAAAAGGVGIKGLGHAAPEQTVNIQGRKRSIASEPDGLIEQQQHGPCGSAGGTHGSGRSSNACTGSTRSSTRLQAQRERQQRESAVGGFATQ
eukprot:1143495-Pelagomonas_calceolata.AAC.3